MPSKRPLRNAKTDVRLAANAREGIPVGSQGGTSKSVYSPYSRSGATTSSRDYVDAMSKSLKRTDSVTTWKAGERSKSASTTRTVGSYAKNYFKKNSK